jgi:hypothetical protein
LTTPYVLALWIDVDPGARDEVDHWYVHKHIAERVRLAGWRRARRFRSIGATRPDTLAVYEVDRADQLVSEDYLSLQRLVDAQDRRMRATFSNVVRGTFRVEQQSGPGEGGVLVSLRFRPEVEHVAAGTAAAWVKGSLAAQVQALAGVVGLRLMISEPELRARHDSQRKSGSEDAHAHWVLLVEATEDDRLQPIVDLLAAPEGVQRFCSEPVAVGCYRLMYGADQRRPGASTQGSEHGDPR